MDNRTDVYHYSQIALQQMKSLSETLGTLSTLVSRRSYSDDIMIDITTNLATMKMKMSVLSDINESLTI